MTWDTHETNTGLSRSGKQSISQPESSSRHQHRLGQATCPAETFFQLPGRKNKLCNTTIASFGKYFHGGVHGTSFPNILFGHRNENGSVFKRALRLRRALDAGVFERQPHVSKSWLVCQGTKGAAVPLRALPCEEQGPTHGEGSRSGPIHIAAAAFLKGLQFGGFRVQVLLRCPAYFTAPRSLAVNATAHGRASQSAAASTPGQNPRPVTLEN